MIKYIFLIAGVIPSALAQILLKFAAEYNKIGNGGFVILFVALAVCSYGVAFILYTIVFKYFPVSVASPIMTVCVMLIVFAFGFFIGETITIKQVIGCVLGICSVILIVWR